VNGFFFSVMMVMTSSKRKWISIIFLLFKCLNSVMGEITEEERKEVAQKFKDLIVANDLKEE
jgi:hypothetical protein